MFHASINFSSGIFFLTSGLCICALSGIETILWLDDFKSIFQQLSTQCETFYFNTNEHYRQNVETETREDRFIKWCRDNYPAHKTAKSNPILQELRAVKTQEEIQQIQIACDITEKGIRRILSFVKPKQIGHSITL